MYFNENTEIRLIDTMINTARITYRSWLIAFGKPYWDTHRSIKISDITGCKFSRAHTPLSLALVEVQNKGRVWCRQKNVRQAGVAMTTKGA
jgi:hypothetical protein